MKKKEYHLALLHFVYLLINSDEHIDDREMALILKIKTEEEIDDASFLEFSRSIAQANRQDIFNRGLELLNKCSEEAKLCAFVYLFQLAEADNSISMKETRMLINALNATHIDFKDVEYSANLVSIKKGNKAPEK